LLAFGEAAVMTNHTTFPSLGVSRDNPPPALPAVVADSGRTPPLGYIQLGVATEVAPTLLGFGLDPDPVIRASSRMLLWDGCSPYA
jgi:hypothetical protein